MLTPISTAVRSYYTVVRAGNISFRVALDTASSDLWLLSSTCSSNACKNIPTYPLSYPSPSFTTVNNNETAFNLSFADGSGEPAINNCVGVALIVSSVLLSFLRVPCRRICSTGELQFTAPSNR